MDSKAECDQLMISNMHIADHKLITLRF